ncbi:hypothetical protein CcaverHIS002_0201020 [Cutaneotrichosporon cavernicola]|uniref:Uncharacterized protein n=1 Tax=Cutaneotrichosporon cavernicola TaxID=279322 RepID=A0AA48L0W2_9TREE|nr:uncharacterized protein CcaverHIS019_0201070 [Cutaneotrichosporon cavernicola]BEI80942.1 hypothetical protein CcaverHIS002_0201020 [Cutaneotrichosporon cavernicola]BEI88745.1 hypothetical protein CcaverHIS019_0201070 [Cutaneotrichosporon cavernicola]BEI96520.1 hypothetical protein CcaverHIS631_0201090 [Cutaneotrichosporon cavernicola]BEJ04292.1 hypothetical protein CcaverHIS641_0201090 [Cutaneotrichosporon cavernicola]
MLLEQFITATLVLALATAVAALQPLASTLIARNPQVTCSEFVHNPDNSTWNNSYKLPFQRLTPWEACPAGSRCNFNVTNAKVGWKYYWDVPDGVTVNLGRYDPASIIGVGFNDVVSESLHGAWSLGASPNKYMVSAVTLVPRAVVVPGTFKCDKGIEYPGTITLPGTNELYDTIIRRDEGSDKEQIGIIVLPPDAPGSQASIMSADELKGRKDNTLYGPKSGARRSNGWDTRLVGVLLAFACVSGLSFASL